MPHRRYAVVDVETTGLRPDHDRIVDLAVLTLDRPGKTADIFTTMVRPDDGRRLSHPVLESAPTFADIAGAVAARLEGVVVAGYNAGFDVDFLRAELTRTGRGLSHDLPTLDVRLLARLFLGADESLATVCEQFELEHRNPHTALGDSTAVARLLTYLLDLADELGVDPLQTLAPQPSDSRSHLEIVPAERSTPRDPLTWPGRPHHERTPRLLTTMSFDDATVAAVARRALQELLSDPAFTEEQRAQVRERLANDDETLAAWCGTLPAEPTTPTEQAISNWRELPGGLVGRHLRRQLLPQLEGTPEYAGALEELVWDDLEHGRIEEAVAATADYAAAPEADENRTRRITRKLIERALEDRDRAGLDLVLASLPWAKQCTFRDAEDLGTELSIAAYGWFTSQRHEAIALARLATTLPGSDEALWRRRAIEAHLIERDGRVAEARALHESAWSAGSRDWLAADRLSLILMRAGDRDGAAAILIHALEHPPHQEQRWSVVKGETLSKRLVRCR